MIQSACGLDCYDACAIVASSGKLKGGEDRFTSGVLCSVLNRHIAKASRIMQPTIEGVEVTMEVALEALSKVLDKDSLLYRGSGNVGVMQEVTHLLFNRLSATIANGSLCDGAGEAGIAQGRGVNRLLTPQHIGKAEVIVVWGRNIDTTNTHLLPYLKGKKLVVIDPIQTAIAKQADVHLQIAPRSDLYLALLLCRFVIMQDMQKVSEFDGIEDFYDFTRTFRIKLLLERTDLKADNIAKVVELLGYEKVVHLVGVGVQKYSIGDAVLRAIDALAVILGHYGKEGCGVSFLGNSKLSFNNPFAIQTQTISKVNTPFGRFKSVLIQGANPAHSMPDTNRVIKELKKVENLIYFGTYHNETSQLAKIVIPALNFLEKSDVRLSYSDYSIKAMNPITQANHGISEYAFTRILIEKLGSGEIDDERSYIDSWLTQATHGVSLAAKNMLRFETFEFLEEIDDDFEAIKNLTDIKNLKNTHNTSGYWLLTPKAKHAINSQFKRDNSVEIHCDLGFHEGEKITLTTLYGTLNGIVKINNGVRQDCVMVRANVTGVNRLTPSIVSNKGNSACFQETKVTLTK